MDTDNSGHLSLAEFQQVIDNFKIPGISASDAQRLFNVFDKSGDGSILFKEFLTTLCGEMSAYRQRLVQEAFQQLDRSGNGKLEMSEVKQNFDPSRHPDVISGVKTSEEARFSFFEMFTTFHNASTGFSGETAIDFDEFLEYHLYLNESFERDIEFKNFIIGVWNLDIKKVPQDVAGVHPDNYGKNSHEQWKRVNH